MNRSLSHQSRIDFHTGLRIVSISLLVFITFGACVSTPDGPSSASPERNAERDTPERYVEALPPVEKPTIAVAPVTNETTIADLDVLSATLTETITLNLNLIGDYKIVSRNGVADRDTDTAEAGETPDYIVSGSVAEDTDGNLLANITVVTRETGTTDTITEPVTALLEVFTTADLLSGRVLRYFVDEIITVGTITIVDEQPVPGVYTVYVDGELSGSTLRELRLLTGTRAIEIRRDDVPIFYRNVVVEADESHTITINSQRYRDTKVALVLPADTVFGSGDFADQVEAGFNQSVQNYSLNGSVERLRSIDTAPGVIERIVRSGTELILFPGWEMESLLRSSAVLYPTTTFIGIDVELYETNDLPRNAWSVLLREDDAGYLAGIVAGYLTKEYAGTLPQLNAAPRVGAVLGMEIPPVERYYDGFYRGVLDSDSDVSVLSRVTNTFTDRRAGRQAADELIDEGVDIVFNIAGETGIGVIQQAERRGILAIGVDTDQWSIAPETVVTSATKDYHAMTYLAIQRWLAGDLPSETPILSLGIVDGITPLAPFHRFEPYIPFAIRRQLDEAVQQMRGMEIDTDD
ncbi:MAG: BMP family ABC transporter substrate-binding protein [Spirochaeta sp.]|jgi:basic membrane protein A|nr:BMP family ABC transporter substrate-binding protein [Spirochaeta sp.]